MEGGNRRKRIDYRLYDQFMIKVDGNPYLVWIIDKNEPTKWCPSLVGPIYLDCWCPEPDESVDPVENVYFISRSIKKDYWVNFLQFEILKRTRFKNSKKPWLDALKCEIGSLKEHDLYEYLVYRRQHFRDIYELLLSENHILREEALMAMLHLDCEIRKITQ